MGIDRSTLDQIRQLLRPLATRIANTVARGVVQYASDGTKLQLLQVGALEDETLDDAEHHQSYGFSSVPLAGAEAVLVFPNGDHGHPLVVAVSDRRHRPTGGEPGEVTMYSHTGARVTMLASGDIEVQPGPGGEVLIREEGGTAGSLLKLSEFLNHTHPSFGAPPAEIAPSTPPGFAGTTVLKAE